MQKILLLPCALIALAVSAFAATAQQRMTTDQLIAYATSTKACGEDRTVVEARYESETGNRITVTCGDATGFLPVAAGLGGLGAAGAAVAGIGLAAAAAGGGGSTPDTQ